MKAMKLSNSFTVTVSEAVFKTLENKRGIIPRSAFIRQILERVLMEKESK